VVTVRFHRFLTADGAGGHCGLAHGRTAAASGQEPDGRGHRPGGC
jgi:hypothetical protein